MKKMKTMKASNILFVEFTKKEVDYMRKFWGIKSVSLAFSLCDYMEFFELG